MISGTRCALLGDAVVAAPLGPLHLKGKEAPVNAFVLQSLRPRPLRGRHP